MTISAFTPERLVLARHRRRMTLAGLARASRLTPTTLTAFENRRTVPSQKSVDALAHALDVTPAFLSAPAPAPVPHESLSLRAPSKISAVKRKSAVAIATLTIALNTWLEARLRMPLPNFPRLPRLVPEDAADALRSWWHLGDAPVVNLTHVLEANGVRVFTLPADCADIGAFSTLRDSTPFIFLPPGQTGDQTRLDLAHELGQFVLHPRQPGMSRESLMDTADFASAFLLPRTAVLAAGLRGATAEHIKAATDTWGIPATTLLRRLHGLDLIPEWPYWRMMRDLSQTSVNASTCSTPENSLLLSRVVELLRNHGLREAAEQTALSDQRLGVLDQSFVVSGVSAGVHDPFDDPAAGQNHEAGCVLPPADGLEAPGRRSRS